MASHASRAYRTSGRNLPTKQGVPMQQEKTIPVRVAVRCRPLVTKELIEGCQVRTRAVPNERTIMPGGDKAFTYDYVFGQETRQASVYDTCVSSLIPKLFEVFNVTILAYGQTGSGKTFTMGTSCSSSSAASEEAGIIPRAVQDIFQRIALASDKVFLVRAFFVELTELEKSPAEQRLRDSSQ